MKSVGEVMAIGRTFKEAFLKGLRSLEDREPVCLRHVDDEIASKTGRPTAQRFYYLRAAFERQFDR